MTIPATPRRVLFEGPRQTATGGGRDRTAEWQDAQGRSAPLPDPAKDPSGAVAYQVRPGDTFSSIAPRVGQTDKDLEAANPGVDPRRLRPGDRIVILDDVRREAATQQLKALDTAHRTHGTAGQEAWAGVQPLVEAELRRVGRDGPTPGDRLDGAIGDIKARAPGDARFATIVDQARQTVEREWEGQGRTHAATDTILALAGDAQAADRSAAAIANDPEGNGPTPTDRVGAAANAAQHKWDLVTQAAVPQLEALAKGVGSPAEAETKVAQRAASLSNYGPDDEQYRSAIDAAAREVLVGKPSRAVADAYASGGAPAAAAKLREVAGQASPVVAARILQASQPVIDKISADLGREAREKLPAPGAAGPGSNPIDLGSIDETGIQAARKDKSFGMDATFAVTLGDLAAAADRAGLAPDGKTAVKGLASSLAEQMPDVDDMRYAPGERPAHDVAKAFAWTVGQGDGATLSLAVAAAMPADRRDYGNALVAAAAEGLGTLRQRVVADVGAFGDATKTLAFLKQGPGQLLDQAQFQKAMAAYLKAHPDTADKAAAAYDTVARGGDALLRTAAAINAYEPELGGSGDFAKLKGARDDTGDRDALEFAVKSSPATLVELANLSDEVERPPPGKVTPWWPIRGTQDFVNEVIAYRAKPAYDLLSQAQRDGGLVPRTGVTAANGMGKANRLAGTVLAGIHADAMFQNQDLFSQAYGLYFASGAGKYGLELLGGMVQSGIAKLPQLQGGRLDRLSDFVAVERRPWQMLSGALGKAYIPLDAAYTVYNLAKGDIPRAIFFGGTATADVMLAYGSGAVPVVGAALLLASAVGNYIYGKIEKANENEDDAREFLTGADLRPEIADQLADHDSDGNSVGPALAALARRRGLEPAAFTDYLNRLTPQQVSALVQQAKSVRPDDKGRMPVAGPGDSYLALPLDPTRTDVSQYTTITYNGASKRWEDPVTRMYWDGGRRWVFDPRIGNSFGTIPPQPDPVVSYDPATGELLKSNGFGRPARAESLAGLENWMYANGMPPPRGR
ncbi:LysM peptidoglycan-binding domain-containing protein [Inquilinus sp. NPDC058860]|uniref:LysM peptidoglycan-binding domain-containing protein n=1 Tax=Inquilinus sp. NPDC058860 TaxID=3346652 RepID=UPI0036BF2E44